MKILMDSDYADALSWDEEMCNIGGWRLLHYRHSKRIPDETGIHEVHQEGKNDKETIKTEDRVYPLRYDE